MLAAASVAFLAAALVFDLTGDRHGTVAADILGGAGLVLLVLAVIFPRWPGGDR